MDLLSTKGDGRLNRTSICYLLNLNFMFENCLYNCLVVLDVFYYDRQGGVRGRCTFTTVASTRSRHYAATLWTPEVSH